MLGEGQQETHVLVVLEASFELRKAEMNLNPKHDGPIRRLSIRASFWLRNLAETRQVALHNAEAPKLSYMQISIRSSKAERHSNSREDLSIHFGTAPLPR